jgi:DNA polymerase IV
MAMAQARRRCPAAAVLAPRFPAYAASSERVMALLRELGPADEPALLGPLPVTRLPGVGPATAQALHRLGVTSVGGLAAADPADLVAALGTASGTLLHRLARGDDPRRVSAERETRSVGSETTFERDLVDPARLRAELDAQATDAVRRLRSAALAARTVTVKVRRHDFATLTRSATLAGATDDLAVVRREAQRLLAAVDTSDGVRLLGVQLSGLTDHVQEQLEGLFGPDAPEPPPAPPLPAAPSWPPGADVEHAGLGRGWVWGSGLARVTVRFETRAGPPGPVRTFAADDPDLRPAGPEPLPEALPSPSLSGTPSLPGPPS